MERHSGWRSDGRQLREFRQTSLGATGGSSGGIGVSFAPDGQAVQGSESGVYAAPYLSNGDGVLFGDPSNGPDTTTGLGSVTLSFPGLEHYVGLLWGSVDTHNTLSFYNGPTLVGSITGSQVTASADGDQGINGTYYVNVDSSQPFNTVVATSSQYAFEFDNVAYNHSVVSLAAVPEPTALAVLGDLPDAGGSCDHLLSKIPCSRAHVVSYQ